MKELELQKLVRNYLSSKPLTNFKTKSGKVIQIISPGILNVSEGPDFTDFAVMKNGKVIVGDAEFHRKANEWIAHGHSNDKNYDNVILHIVFDDNSDLTDPDILVLNKNDIVKLGLEDKQEDLHSTEEIQHFALLRLLRKSTIAQKNINQSGQKEGVRQTVLQFLQGYIEKKRRPIYDDQKIIEFIETFDKSAAYNFLESIIDGVEFDIYKKLEEIIKLKMHNEGKGLRIEILINCVLPLALCLAESKNRVKLLEWYWSVKAMNEYGLLKRRFENIAQNYVWQQQGMLEYLKDHGSKKTITAEEIQNYGINEILDFYEYGKME